MRCVVLATVTDDVSLYVEFIFCFLLCLQSGPFQHYEHHHEGSSHHSDFHGEQEVNLRANIVIMRENGCYETIQRSVSSTYLVYLVSYKVKLVTEESLGV